MKTKIPAWAIVIAVIALIGISRSFVAARQHDANETLREAQQLMGE